MMWRTCGAVIACALITAIPLFGYAADDNAQCKGKKDGTPVKAQGRDIEGVCEKGQFKATKADGKAIDAGLQALMQALQGMLGKLGGGGGGSGGGSGSGAASTPTSNPLTNAANSVLESLRGSATTSPNGPNSSVGDILNGVFGEQTTNTVTTLEAKTDTTTSVDTTIKAVTKSSGTAVEVGGNTTVSASANTNTTAITNQTNGTDVGNTVLNEGLAVPRGDISEKNGAATIQGGVRLNNENAEVAGFFGTNNTTGTSQSGIVGRMCTARPWAGGFLERFISPSFFDDLCNRFGLTAGGVRIAPSAPMNTTQAQKAVEKNKAQQQEGVVTTDGPVMVGIRCNPEVVRVSTEAVLSFSCGKADLTATAGFSVKKKTETRATVTPTLTTKYGIQCSDERVYTCSIAVVDPRLSIWAEPKEVSLGTRAQIYWIATDVYSETCTVKGPSFLEKGERGGAATVPINDPSTYTFTCIGRDNATTTASVTVELDL